MSSGIVAICLAVVIFVYFYNNPLKHGAWFLSRRFINWFPLGMTYAFLYMGRYNLSVAKNALGPLMANEDFGIISGTGTLVYALSFLVNGPLVARIGGKKGIIIAATGSALANIALGVVTWLVLTDRWHVPLLGVCAGLYGVNMYFQSYGAMSIIKVKANWFHVRERGLFGAIFSGLGVVLVPQLGAATFIALLVTGQMLASVAFDHFGWLGLAQRPIDLSRVIGVILLIAGVVLIRR